MEKRVAIITGASRGIGLGISLALAQNQWHIIINFKNNAESAGRALEQVLKCGSTGKIIQGDISRADDREKLVDSSIQDTGRIDLLVNNAGIGPRVRVDLLHASVDSFREVLATNLEGPFFLTQAVANRMIPLLEAKIISDPKIINIGSVSAIASSTDRGEYCISKAGLGMATLLWADRLSQYGINVYELRPGIITTEMTAKVKDKYDRLIFNDGITLIKRWGTPEDVGRAVVAIAEGVIPYSTGEIIYLDGGLHHRRF